MKRSVLFGALLALVVVSMAFAQGKPNFSGKWTPEQAAGAPPAGGGGGRGMGAGPMTVTQNDKTLTVERTMGENTMKTVYNLDGTESKNEMSRGGQTMTQTSTAKWDGSKLVITTKSEGPNGPMETTQTWSLNGDKLQIERQGRQGPVTTTYTKG
jgi:hypothetical protein